MKNRVLSELDPRQYKCDESGHIKAFETSVIIPLTTDKDEYELEDKVRLLKAKVVGLRVEEPLSTAQYLSSTLTAPNSEAYNSAVLNLRDMEKVFIEDLNLRQIQKDNDNGFWYEVRAGAVNFKESTLKVYKNDTIGANQAIKIMIQYVKPIKPLR